MSPPPALLLAMLLAAPAARAQTFDPAFTGYSLANLGSVPGLPAWPGPINFAVSGGGVIDYDRLIVGAGANGAAGALYSVPVVRGAGGHITGFGGAATFYAEAAYNDGGATYGPGNVLFLARWPLNQIGQTKPGSQITDRIVDLSALGVAESPGGLTFVPSTHPGAGRLKMVAWTGGGFYDLSYAPDGSGTYDVTSATFVTTLGGGPEGFVYVPIGSSGFAVPSMLLAEFDNSVEAASGYASVVAYELDALGNPLAGTRRVFLRGLAVPEGMVVDPLTGDVLITQYGLSEDGPDHVYAVRGFVAAVPEPSTAALLFAGVGVLALGGVRRRRACRLAVGALAIGAVLATPSQARAQVVTLDFTGLGFLAVPPTYGTVPGVVSVASSTVLGFGNTAAACGGGGAEVLKGWPAYGGLSEVAYTCANGTVGQFFFQPAAGNTVFLNSLQLASVVGTRAYTVNVYDASWSLLSSAAGFVDVTPVTVTPNVSSATGLYLQWGTDWNFAVDNVTVTVAPTPGSVVPEPGSLALLGTGLLIVAAGAARRRRA